MAVSFPYLGGAPWPWVLPVAVAPLDLLPLVDEGQHAGVAAGRAAHGPGGRFNSHSGPGLA